MMRRALAWTLFGITATALTVTLVWPLAWVLRGGLFGEHGFTLEVLRSVFRNPIYVEGLLNSLKLAAGTTVLAVLLGLPLAWLANRYTFRGKGLLTALLLVPMVLPPFVGAIGFQQMLGQYGALNALLGTHVDWLGQGRYFGVIVLQALALYPILYLNAAAALANVDPAMEEAAANLGAPTGYAFRRVILPLIMPGLFAGGTLVFIWSFTELGTPLIMSYGRCASVQVYDALKEIGSSAFPFALVLVMLACSTLLYAASKLAGEEFAHAFSHVYGIETVALRLFNVYGPRQNPESEDSGVITRFLSRLAAGEAPLVDGDGQQSRDFIFVSDIVAAFLRAAKAPEASGEVFNIGSGRSTTINELATTLTSTMLPGSSLRPMHRAARVGDVRHSCADITKAKSILKFEPTVSLRDGLAKTVAWWREEWIGR